MEHLTGSKDLAARAVEQYGDMVLRLAFQRTGNQADAEDIAQEVFLSLLAEREFQGEEHLKRWLVRAVINRCENLRRSAWKRKTVALPEAWPVFDTGEAAVLEELWSLQPKDRDVIYLHYYEGYTIVELAELLGENPNTISARLTRARQKLKVLLKEGECSG